jgi:replicative DNA helicase
MSGPTKIYIPPELEKQLDQQYAAKARQPVLAALKSLGLSNLEDHVDEAISALRAIAGPQVKPAIPFKDRIRETLDYIEQLATTKPQSVIKFGIDALDNALLPIEPGNQIIICAETGGGKTALALQAALSSPDKAFGIFSLEMDVRSLIMRMLTSEASVPFSKLRQGRLAERDYQRLTSAVGRLGPRNIHIEDESAVDVQGIATRCRALKRTQGLDAVVVDYLQLVTPATKRDSSREREVSEISRSLKRLALELGVVVIALSQLNDDGRLRESRAIGQDADVVLKVAEGDSGHSIQIKKHRNGPIGAFPVTFDGAHMRFSGTEQPTRLPYPEEAE